MNSIILLKISYNKTLYYDKSEMIAERKEEATILSDNLFAGLNLPSAPNHPVLLPPSNSINESRADDEITQEFGPIHANSNVLISSPPVEISIRKEDTKVEQIATVSTDKSLSSLYSTEVTINSGGSNYPTIPTISTLLENGSQQKMVTTAPNIPLNTIRNYDDVEDENTDESTSLLISHTNNNNVHIASNPTILSHPSSFSSPIEISSAVTSSHVGNNINITTGNPISTPIEYNNNYLTSMNVPPNVQRSTPIYIGDHQNSLHVHDTQDIHVNAQQNEEQLVGMLLDENQRLLQEVQQLKNQLEVSRHATPPSQIRMNTVPSTTTTSPIMGTAIPVTSNPSMSRFIPSSPLPIHGQVSMNLPSQTMSTYTIPNTINTTNQHMNTITPNITTSATTNSSSTVSLKYICCGHCQQWLASEIQSEYVFCPMCEHINHCPYTPDHQPYTRDRQIQDSRNDMVQVITAMFQPFTNCVRGMFT